MDKCFYIKDPPLVLKAECSPVTDSTATRSEVLFVFQVY